MPGCSAARSATNATCAPHRGTPARPSASTPAQPGTQHDEVTMRGTLARPTDVPRASRPMRALGVPGVPGRTGRPWSNRAYLVRSSDQVRPFPPAIARVLGRNGRSCGYRASRPLRAPGVPGVPGRTGRTGRTWSKRAYLVRSSNQVRPFLPAIAPVLGRSGRTCGNRAPRPPGVPTEIGRTWSVLPTRYARFHQPSRPPWEVTGTQAAVSR